MTRKPLLGGDRGRLGRYIRDTADLMGLRDWHFEVSVSSNPQATNHQYAESSRTVATCFVAHGSQRAEIDVADDWASWVADDLRRMVVHELVHCHMEKMRWAFNNVQSAVGSGGAVWSVLADAFDDMHELSVDTISYAWSERLPLPGR